MNEGGEEELITPGKMFESAEEMWWYIDTFIEFLLANRKGADE